MVSLFHFDKRPQLYHYYLGPPASTPLHRLPGPSSAHQTPQTAPPTWVLLHQIRCIICQVHHLLIRLCRQRHLPGSSRIVCQVHHLLIRLCRQRHLPGSSRIVCQVHHLLIKLCRQRHLPGSSCIKSAASSARSIMCSSNSADSGVIGGVMEQLSCSIV